MIEDNPQTDETPEDIPVGDLSGETDDVQDSVESSTGPAADDFPGFTEVEEDGGGDEFAGIFNGRLSPRYCGHRGSCRGHRRR